MLFTYLSTATVKSIEQLIKIVTNSTKICLSQISRRGLITSNETIQPGVDRDCFRHRYTDFGHTNLDVPIFNLKQNCIVCTPPLSSEGVEPPTKFSKRAGLTRPQLLEGGFLCHN